MKTASNISALPKPLSANAITELEAFQQCLDNILREAYQHCCDMNTRNLNTAGIIIDIKELFDYLCKFSANLKKLLVASQENFHLKHVIANEIQLFIKYKAKSLKTVIPSKESEVTHGDWWGKTFKQITQKLYKLEKPLSNILPDNSLKSM